MKTLKSTLFIVLFVSFSGLVQASCDDPSSFLDRACQRLSDTWTQGSNDIYIPFHTYHLRFAYSADKIDSFREDNWGLGYGRSRYDEDGNWDGLYGMAFLDSHSDVEPMVGYGHEWMWGERQGLHAGLGYTVLVTARRDIRHYLPFPAVLPIASVNYKDAALNATFVPGGEGNGNVFFFWTRFGF